MEVRIPTYNFGFSFLSSLLRINLRGPTFSSRVINSIWTILLYFYVNYSWSYMVPVGRLSKSSDFLTTGWPRKVIDDNIKNKKNQKNKKKSKKQKSISGVYTFCGIAPFINIIIVIIIIFFLDFWKHKIKVVWVSYYY